MPSGAKPKVYPSEVVEKVRELYAAMHTQMDVPLYEIRTLEELRG